MSAQHKSWNLLSTQLVFKMGFVKNSWCSKKKSNGIAKESARAPSGRLAGGTAVGLAPSTGGYGKQQRLYMQAVDRYSQAPATVL